MVGGVILGGLVGSASGQHLLVPDQQHGRVMLFDAGDGHLVNANYITRDVGPLNFGIEAIQVNNEIWVSDRFADAIRRFSLDGRSFIGSVVGPFNPPLKGPEGLAFDGSTVFVTCIQIQQHGLVATWITKLGTNGASQGIFTIPDDRHRYDVAIDGAELLVTDTDDHALDRHSPANGALLGRIDAFPQDFAHTPTQVLRLSTGEIALGTTKGLRIYDAAGTLIEQHLPETSINGVGELGTGELMLTMTGSVVAYDRDTGAQRVLASGVNARFVSEITGVTVCAGDANADGEVTPADFTAWIAAFNAQGPQCDQNDDGACSPDDFSAWVAHFNAGC